MSERVRTRQPNGRDCPRPCGADPVVIVAIARRYKVAGPNEAFIITGRNAQTTTDPVTGQAITEPVRTTGDHRRIGVRAPSRAEAVGARSLEPSHLRSQLGHYPGGHQGRPRGRCRDQSRWHRGGCASRRPAFLASAKRDQQLHNRGHVWLAARNRRPVYMSKTSSKTAPLSRQKWPRRPRPASPTRA